jgi:hypothetical protein
MSLSDLQATMDALAKLAEKRPPLPPRKQRPPRDARKHTRLVVREARRKNR